MEIIQVELRNIVPNPDQSRETEDLEHVKRIALSIAQNGLMQIPIGRWIFPDGQRVTGMGTADLTGSGLKVQLAFGHSRLAAFHWLEDVKDHSDLKGDWSRMPVIVRDLTDEELFRLGISENVARKDLNPIEEARAMLVYREKFNKTSAEIGALFGLGDSTVRNKMRLLSLPEALQNALRSAEITEGVARALLPLYEVPEALRQAAEDSDELKPSEIIEAARSGISPDRVTDLVNRFIHLVNPQPEQAAIDLPPVPSPVTVSTETVKVVEPVFEEYEGPEEFDEIEDEDLQAETADNEESHESDAVIADDSEVKNYDPADELTEEPEEPVAPAPVSVETPAPRPAPAPIPPAAPPRAQSAPAPTTKPAPQPAQPVAPAPAPAATAPLTWEKSIILLSLTLWPEDASGERMVNIGARLNQDPPLMAIARLSELILPAQLATLLNRLSSTQPVAETEE